MATRTFIIAEAGVNHNGSTDIACELIDVAAEAGADAVKFQTFQASELISRYAPKAVYQVHTTGTVETQLEMVQKLELSVAAHEVLIRRAREKGIRFLSTPFDLPSLRLLTDRFDLDVIKVPSGEVTNGPFLVEIARTGRRVILSTGMSTLGEVEHALGALAYGGMNVITGRQLRLSDLRDAYLSEAGKRYLHAHVSILHCTSEYPAPFSEVNLRAIDTLAAAFGLPVGLSDHTVGIHIPIAAVARGSNIIEKHFTLDRKLPGPDHAASLEPNELKCMVQAIRDIETSFGDGVKRPSASEMKNRDVVRRSVVASKPIKAGEIFSELNVTCKRPGTFASPMTYWEILGRVAMRDYDIDEGIDA